MINTRPVDHRFNCSQLFGSEWGRLDLSIAVGISCDSASRARRCPAGCSCSCCNCCSDNGGFGVIRTSGQQTRSIFRDKVNARIWLILTIYSTKQEADQAGWQFWPDHCPRNDSVGSGGAGQMSPAGGSPHLPSSRLTSPHLSPAATEEAVGRFNGWWIKQLFVDSWEADRQDMFALRWWVPRLPAAPAGTAAAVPPHSKNTGEAQIDFVPSWARPQ